MLLKVKRDTLLKPLNATIGFAEKKQMMPILANVFISKTGNNLTFVANDMEIQAKVIIEEEMAGDDFMLTLPAKKLLEILKTLPEDQMVVLEQQDGRVLLKAGRARFVLQSLPADHYPLLKINDECIGQFSINQGIMKDLVSNVYYAMGISDGRVFLNGMFLEVKNNQLCLITTDAHRLSYASYQLSDTLPEIGIIIPRKTVLELYRMLENSEEQVIIKIYPMQVCFEMGNKQLITKIISGHYPDYNRVIPLTNDKLCLVNREELLKAVQRVAVIDIDKLKTIMVTIKPNILCLKCINEEQEESCDELSVQYASDAEIELNFNVAYMLEVLTHCKAETLQFAFYNNKRSVLITIPNEVDFKHVIMPLRD